MKPFLFLFFLTCNVEKLCCQVPGNSLDLWLKSDTGIIFSRNKVIAWQDQSGNKNDATVKSTVAPEYLADQLNGYPVLRFNGKDMTMETKAFPTFPNKRGSVFMVLRLNGKSYSSGSGISSLVSTYFGEGTTWQFCSSTELYIFFDGVGSEGFPVAATRSGDWEAVSLIRESDTTMQLYRKGELRTDFRISNNQPAVNPVKIGSNGRLEVMNGDIAEIIIYGRALAPEEIKQVNDYLLRKYKLSLPQKPINQTGWIYIGIALAAVIIAVIMTKYLSQRKLRKRIRGFEISEKLDQERQRISREMHDDIGAGLTQITLMSELAKKKRGISSESELENIAETSRKLVSSMSEIIWSLNPENKSLEQLCAYLREELNNLLEYSEMDFSIILPDIQNKIMLSGAVRRNVLLVTKEIVNNAVKYSKAKKITIKAELEKDELKFEIKDDGIGFDSEKIYAGNGLKNIYNRVSESGGSIKVESAPNEGSSFFYTFKINTT